MPYTLNHIEERVLLVLKLYDKINPDNVSILWILLTINLLSKLSSNSII